MNYNYIKQLDNCDKCPPKALSYVLKREIEKRSLELGKSYQFSESTLSFEDNRNGRRQVSNEEIKQLLEYVITVAMNDMFTLRNSESQFPINFNEEAKGKTTGGRIQKKNKKATRRRNRK